ncbi:hypothetical protein JHS3_26860 [Jeongeupia sp. HS-3]|uniref:hypothetical protein n=1 Tax=Jeongeupia sp. HS-3 TaxID=1009682 RepID=UPI0018A3DFB8|nr:hypothetical protein [Jeongeupia sp. HS-3]BCL76950.1 hypothetical protein JHS3_26860 [Jeongeupia sp. HS-3]
MSTVNKHNKGFAMQGLASAIGYSRLQAVIDDFVAALRQHPWFATVNERMPEFDVLRRRLLAFWHAVLDGESYRLPPALPHFAEVDDGKVSECEWRTVNALFTESIDRHLPPHLAEPWRQRLDVISQSLPLSQTRGG